MTREVAEEYVKDMTYRDAVHNALQGKCIPYRKATLIKLYELLDKLEQEPCEDAISRQAVLDKKELIELEDGQSFYCISPEDVETLPPATPHPKTGHWIFQDITQGKRMWCSNCNLAFDLCCNQIKRYDEATKKEYLWGHCPWCGAKMVEPQEREVSNADSN